jgi:putative aldouronate transport system substrate-binding protein
MNRRWSLLLLVFLMIISAGISGCRFQQDSSKSGAEDDIGIGHGVKNNLTPAGTYPIVKDKITLRVLAPRMPEIMDYSTNEFTKWYEEKTNIHIQWDIIPSDSMREKVHLILASGEYPDIFFGVGIKDLLEEQYGVEQGVFLPLDDLIETSSVEFKKVLRKHETLPGRITATDGKIYSLPSWNDCFHCSYSQKLWINQNWLKKLNLQMPATTEQFYEVLKAFKEQDPNGNGKQDEIALAGAMDGWHSQIDSFIMNAFTLDSGMYEPLRMIVENGKVKTIVDSPEYREGLRYLNRLYKEGLLYAPSFTQKLDQLKALAASPDDEIIGAFTVGASVNVIDGSTYPERYRHFTTLAPLQGPSGVRYATHYKYNAARPGAVLISSTSKHPEAAFRWADGMYEFETQFRKAAGRKGYEWADPHPGDLGLDGKPALIRRIRPYSNEPQNFAYMGAGLEYAPSEWRFGEATSPGVDIYSPQGLEKLLYLETKNKYEPYAPSHISVLPPIRLLNEENQELQTVRIELENYISESRVRFITGDLDLNGDWESYVENLQNIGIRKLLEIYQRGYDRQKLNP